ncbi:arsenic transporter [Pedobacter mucosus]|uniref:arsenic transporter n=1 Tax=Pedobacter mucosus TaxID=2895286 RepID=UPI001EE3D007|nr:arsenic transporter [Pedobacter mucosus]UKT64967.1 arsenic transporter [Pedobacter mucosus]
MTTIFFILFISFLAIAGVIIRPFKIPEYVWACTGASFLLLFGLISFSSGIAAVAKGTDVYFFLLGMMLLAEAARIEGLFDWLAAHATKLAQGSAIKLFFLIYLVGTIVTIFLSNDATAVVLTPDVIAAMNTSQVKNPMPYLFICVFIANAASFVLPISNPANLVIYVERLPSLIEWLSHFIIPSLVSIIVTFIILFFLQRKQLRQSISINIAIPSLSKGGITAMVGIVLSATILISCSAMGIALGLPTFLAGLVTMIIIYFGTGRNPVEIVKGLTWQVIPLVAGLFIIVKALAKTGLMQSAAVLLMHFVQKDIIATTWGSGFLTAFVCNLINNLPAGLTAADIMTVANPPEIVRKAILIGIDLGPNLSPTGSLASILWLLALRRENLNVNGWEFLKLGIFVMLVPLIFTIASLYV